MPKLKCVGINTEGNDKTKESRIREPGREEIVTLMTGKVHCFSQLSFTDGPSGHGSTSHV